MIIRSKAPLRLGLAGGGTDVSPYCDIYSGMILNATITMFAYASIEPLDKDNKIVLNSIDSNKLIEIPLTKKLNIDGNLDILKGVYNRIVRDFTKKPLAFKLTTYVDVPPGSGLGSSSTLIVAILSAFAEWLNLPLSEYDMSHLAYEIERIDIGMTGGKQDHYAAAFGGFNFMEFYDNGKVIVNPLRVKQKYINELENNILLFYTGTSRLSSKIIANQIKNVNDKNKKSIEAMHKLKEQAILMKEAILKGNLNELGEILDFGWKYKKKMTDEITNPVIDEIYQTAKKAGALGGKLSGAGGGGFMMLYCPQNARYNVINSLQRFQGEFRRFLFSNHGVLSWKIQ